MAFKNVLAGVAGSKLEVSVEWYTRLLGRGPDQRLMPEVAEFEFPAGGWLQLFEGNVRAGKSSVTLVVDNLDETLADLKTASIPAPEPTRTELVDTVILKDPDGNQVVLAQSKSGKNRSAA
jgi:hypothetical protein